MQVYQLDLLDWSEEIINTAHELVLHKALGQCTSGYLSREGAPPEVGEGERFGQLE